MIEAFPDDNKQAMGQPNDPFSEGSGASSFTMPGTAVSSPMKWASADDGDTASIASPNTAPSSIGSDYGQVDGNSVTIIDAAGMLVLLSQSRGLAMQQPVSVRQSFRPPRTMSLDSDACPTGTESE